jgi:hypothetical protein
VHESRAGGRQRLEGKLKADDRKFTCGGGGSGICIHVTCEVRACVSLQKKNSDHVEPIIELRSSTQQLSRYSDEIARSTSSSKPDFNWTKVFDLSSVSNAATDSSAQRDCM